MAEYLWSRFRAPWPELLTAIESVCRGQGHVLWPRRARITNFYKKKNELTKVSKTNRDSSVWIKRWNARSAMLMLLRAWSLLIRFYWYWCWCQCCCSMMNDAERARAITRENNTSFTLQSVRVTVSVSGSKFCSVCCRRAAGKAKAARRDLSLAVPKPKPKPKL